MAPSLGAEGVCAGFQSSSGQPPALVRMEVQELEDEKHRGALPLGIAVLKVRGVGGRSWAGPSSRQAAL